MEQLDIYLKSNISQLAEVTCILSTCEANVKTSSLSFTAQGPVLHLIADKHEKIKAMLRESEIDFASVAVTVLMADNDIEYVNNMMQRLSFKGIELEHMHMTAARDGKLMLAIRFADEAAGQAVLRKINAVPVARAEDV